MSRAAQLLNLPAPEADDPAQLRGAQAIKHALAALPGDPRPALELWGRAEILSHVYKLDGEVMKGQLEVMVERLSESVLARLDVRGALRRGEEIEPRILERWQRQALAVLRAQKNPPLRTLRAYNELRITLLDSLWLGEGAQHSALCRLRTLLEVAGVAGTPLPQTITVSHGRDFWHSLSEGETTACGKPLPFGPLYPRLGIDRFGYLDCRSCARRLGVARREPLDLVVLLYCFERKLAHARGWKLVCKGGPDDLGELRRRALEQDAMILAEELVALSLGGADRTLCRTLFWRELNKEHKAETRRLLALAIAAPDSERALREMRERIAHL